MATFLCSNGTCHVWTAFNHTLTPWSGLVPLGFFVLFMVCVALCLRSAQVEPRLHQLTSACAALEWSHGCTN